MVRSVRAVSVVAVLALSAGGGPVAPPADARFTIVLLNFEGADHLRAAKRARDLLEKATGLHEFHLVLGETQSTLYYGYYKAVSERDDPAEARRARADLDKLSAVVIDGEKPFQGAVLIGLPTPDPEAPPEWNIRNTKGAYSLEIAVYKDHAERKQAAVDTVRKARSMGVDAYFYHGPNVSSVLVGCFGPDAVQIINPEPQAAAGKELLVLPFKPADIPDEVSPDGVSRTQIVAPEMRIVDPLLKDLMRQFPHHAINGDDMVQRSVDPKTGQTVEQYASSLVIDLAKVRRQSILGAGKVNPDAPPADAPDKSAVAPRPKTPGSGKLKGLK